jgi:DNA polymerase III gamma/tau subunit
MSIALYNKYRPLKFADVLGQDAVVASLQKVIKRGDSQAYLLSGPSGVGKTTLARIAAREAGCSDQTIKEIDAANNSGVDATREVAAAINYRPFGDVEFRANVVDECHNLSKSACVVVLLHDKSDKSSCDDQDAVHGLRIEVGPREETVEPSRRCLRQGKDKDQ